MRDLLAPEMASGLITDAELDALVGIPHDRRKLAHELAGGQGRAGRKAAKHVLHAEMDLAEALASPPPPSARPSSGSEGRSASR